MPVTVLRLSSTLLAVLYFLLPCKMADARVSINIATLKALDFASCSMARTVLFYLNAFSICCFFCCCSAYLNRFQCNKATANHVSFCFYLKTSLFDCLLLDTFFSITQQPVPPRRAQPVISGSRVQDPDGVGANLVSEMVAVLKTCMLSCSRKNRNATSIIDKLKKMNKVTGERRE